MQGNDKRFQRSPQEQLLTEVLHACMEEQLSFIPPEREIARMHTFSESFQEYMKQLLRTKGKSEQKTITKNEFVYRFNKVAAVMLVLLLVGSLSAGAFLLLRPKGAMEKAEAPAAAPAAPMPEEAEDVIEESVEMEEAPAEETESIETESGSALPEETEFMGQFISLAPQQELLEQTESVKTLVTAPLVDREAKNLQVVIGNMQEYPIYYYKVMELEVYIDGAWYTVPSKQKLSEEEQHQMEMLEARTKLEEKFVLEYYDLDYEADKYRIVIYLDGWILSSEFCFAGV